MRFYAIFFIVMCCAMPLLAQQCSYTKVAFTGKYVAEIYSIKIDNGQILNDSVLQSVKSFDDRNYIVEVVEKEGIKEQNIYDKEGNVLVHTAYYYDRDPMASTKSEYEYVNSLLHSTTQFNWQHKSWVKENKALNTYKFNKKGQVIQETRKGEDGTKFFDAYTTYNPNYKLRKPYYDKYSNLQLPGSIETAVVIDGDTMHYNCYNFDAEGRVLQFIYAHRDRSPSTTHNYEYDSAGREIAYNYTVGTRFASRHEFEYDNDGRIIKESEWKSTTDKGLVLVKKLHYHYVSLSNDKK